MLSNEQIARIVMMRGLGFSQSDIAKQFNITQGAISYNLKQLEDKAKKDGLEDTFIKVMAAGGSLDTLRAARLL
jgi:DNA-binding MarR family transcriptional regulator